MLDSLEVRWPDGRGTEVQGTLRTILTHQLDPLIPAGLTSDPELA